RFGGMRMPTSSTFAPASFDARTMRSRLARLCASGSPRRPSLAPSSITTTSGRVRASALPIRDTPPAVVSPLMLALTTVQPGLRAARRSPSSATQPSAAAMPYPADSESPNTSTVRPAGDAAQAGCSSAARHSSHAAHPLAHCARRGMWSTPVGLQRNDILTDQGVAVAEGVAGDHRSALRVSGLGKRVRLPDGELVILEDVSFAIAHGETVAIVGASGSGKSTLLSLMAGLDLPSNGSVELDGAPLSRLDEDGRARVRGEKVGFVFQSFQLLPSLTALENVMLPLELRGDRDAEGPARAILDKVGLGQRLDHYPRQLSGGEQQRVALARAFVTRPSLLFADEPTGNLDTHT